MKDTMKIDYPFTTDETPELAQVGGKARSLIFMTQEGLPVPLLTKIKHVRSFPTVIDSRGKILRPPKKKARAGEMVGEPVSAGRVRGPVKVLSRSDEKPVLPGEILVTRATDPGWTPLFLNAGGIVLEIGGVLQHGAVVAREYCKPCVAGVENATLLLKDGQVVEVDGANGVVRLMKEMG